MAMAWQLSFPVDEPVDVLVTHVERETGNFFVQINDPGNSKLDDLMEKIANYVAVNSGDSKAKTLKVGDACLGKYVDEVWYRGKILGGDRNGYKVFFVDYGNSELVARNNVVSVPEKFLTLPPQAYECELANVKARGTGGLWGTELLVKFEELVLEQPFTAQAISLKTNNVLVLSLFQDATMTTLAAEPLISEGYLTRLDAMLPYVETGPSRSYKFLRLDNFSFEDVHVSYCEDPNKFYCILLKNSTALRHLMEELENTYREAPEDDYPLTSCCENNPCCAKYSEDDMWYRAVITSESPSPTGEITVRFVDYGNSESVLISSLLELNDRFLELPMQALECSLYGIKPTNEAEEWPQDAIDLFDTMTNEKQLVSYLYEVEKNKAEVFLFDTSEEAVDINFGEVMVEHGKAIAVKSLKDYKKANHSSRRKSCFGVIDLVPSTREAVVVTNVDSPSDFYCQILSHSSNLDKLMNDLREYYEALDDVADTITLPQAGMMCCGQYTEDEGWYRALILASDIANRQVEVLYVDYGNTESLPISRIKELKLQFESLPQQAVSCCLYGVKPNGPSWSERAIKEFEDAIVDKELVFKVVTQLESHRYGVILVETVGGEEYSINKLLVQKGLAISEEIHPGVVVEGTISDFRLPAIEVGSYVDVEVTHVESLDQFWCHLMDCTQEMEHLMSNLQEYYDAHQPKAGDSNAFLQGSPCCARFNDDKLWYRARILEKMRNNLFKVRFVDYGNCEVVALKSVAVLNREFLYLPVQAIECSLANLSNSHKKKKKFAHKFLEMVNGKELVCRMDECDDRGKYTVLIIDSGDGETVKINEEMAGLIESLEKHGAGKEPAARLRPELAELNLTPGGEELIYVTCIYSSENFYCQLARTSTQLDKLMNDMESFYRPLSPEEETLTSPAVGDVCCAMFTEDDGFYRAVVTKVSSTTVGVCYVDYGNSEELPSSRVKSLNASFTELPAQSFNAKAFSSSCGTTEEFEAKVVEQELKGKIVRKDENGLYVVQLLDLSGTPLFFDAAARRQGSSKQTPRKVKDAKVPVGQKVRVYITSVTSPDDLFCQFTDTSAELDQLMNEIEEHYRPLGDEQQAYTDPQIGEACCAMFTEDDGWYRATVKKHSGANVDVYYTDYGNSETLPLSRTKVLHGKFTTLPSQGFHACVNVPTGVDATSFKDAVLEQEFDAKIIKGTGDNGYQIELFSADGVKMFGTTADKREPAICDMKEPDIRKGSKEHVYVTCYTSSQNFFCQLVKTTTQLDDLMDKLEEFYRPLGDEDECLNSPHVGDSCCAMFTEDDGWYRAVITKVSGNTVQVKYLDYGNIEELPVSRIKRLSPCYAEVSVQGFQASLIGAESVGEDEVRAAIDGQELMVRVVNKKTNGVYDVEVYEMNGNRLCDSTQAKPQANQSIKDFLVGYNMTAGAQLDVCGSHCDSPKRFYLHILKNKDTLEKIMTELDEVYSDLRPNDSAIANPVVGMFCAAKYPVDGEWYRAKIINIPSPNEVEVCYIDFGNCERTALQDIKSLAPAFYQPAVQAVKCCLLGAKEKWNANECETFEILVLEQQLVVDVKSVDLNTQTLTVELFDTRGSDNLNILNLLNEKASGKPPRSQEKLPKLASLPKLQLKDVENVLVESAESLDNFVCQFTRFNQDMDTLADMMYETYHEGKPPDFVTTPLQVGDVVAAMFTEDDTWYRASVSGLNPDGSVNVMFIDYGNSETISKADVSKRVRHLGKELLRYPVMRGVVCSLSRVSTDGKRYSWTPRAHEAFVRYVVEKEFRARLSSDSEPYKTILEEKSGSIYTWLAREKLVNSSESSEPEVVQDDFYELEVEAGTSCDVYVTSVVNPELFFVQQAANADAIDKVMDELGASCARGSRGAILDVHQGNLCAAQFTADDAWYRAKVARKTGRDLFEVVFVDYGNSEVLAKERIKELDPSLLELPAQALRCGLQLKQPKSWSPEIVEEFETITADKCLRMTVVRLLDGKLLVNIVDEDGVLINDKYEKKQNTVKPDLDKAVEVQLLPYPVTANQTAEVYISHSNGPGDFYLQFSSTDDELSRLTELCEVYDGTENEKYKINNPQKGMYCCARYSDDNAWYRARVIDVDLPKQTATVCFVDHGNTDVVNLLSDLRQLSADLSVSPCQAIPCSLARRPWSAEQCASFEDATVDKPLQATFNELLDNTWLINLKDGDVSLNDSLILCEETHSVKQPGLSIGDEPAVYIVSVNSPDDVVLQLSSYVEDLEALMADIASTPPGRSLPVTAKQCGSYCLAQFTEDDAWYRAKVLELDGDKTKVLYVDHGNEEWVSSDRLAPISQRFTHLLQVCLRCSLDLSSLRAKWNEDVGEKLIKIYGEHELCCKIISETDGCFSVKLFCDEEDVLTKLLTSSATPTTLPAEEDLSSAESPSADGDQSSRGYETKQLKKGDRKDVLCSHIETPHKLWLQFVEDQETLDDLMDRLNEVYNALGDDGLPLKTRDIGSPCCGQFLEDDGWYRAEILAVQDQGVLVRYVDYGNEEVLPSSRLRSLKAEFYTTPRQAVSCSLKDIKASGDEWSPDAVTLVENFTSERSLSVEILSVDKLTVTGLVYGSLEDEEISLCDLLIEKSFAVSISPEAPGTQDSVLSYTNIPVEIGDKINFFYVTAESPASIWCQLSDSEADLLDLMEQLGGFYGGLGEGDWTVEEPVIGMPVCAQFTEDDSWYRAEILQTGTDILVHFVDYGNDEELPRSRIKRLKQDFMALPKQALSLSLSGVSPQTLQEWTEEKQDAMEELCSEKCYVGEVLGITDISLVVSLQHQDSDVVLLDELCEADVITKSVDVLAKAPVGTNEQSVDDTLILEEKDSENKSPSEKQISEDAVAFEEKKSENNADLEDHTPENDAALKEQTSEDSTALEEQTPENNAALEEEIPKDTTALEKKTLENDADLEDQTSENDAALEEETSEDTTALGELTLENNGVLEDQILENDVALEEQTSENDVALEEDTSEDTTALEEQTSENDVALEEDTSEDTTALEEQTSENNAASEDQTPENDAALEEETSEDSTALEDQTPENNTALEEQTLENDVALEEQTSENDAALEEDTSEDTTTLEEQTLENDVALEEDTSEDTTTLEEQTLENDVALEEDTSEDTTTLEEQTLENDVALEEDTSEDTTTLEEQTLENDVAFEDQTSEDTEDTVALEERTLEDTSALQEQIAAVEEKSLKEQPINNAPELKEHSVDTTLVVEESPVHDPSLEEELVDKTTAMEEMLRNDAAVLEENEADAPSDFEEPVPEERPSVGKQDNDIVSDTIVNNNEDDEIKRATSPGDEEDLDDAEAVCHAIDCLLTEIDARTDEEGRITTPEMSDTELASLGVDGIRVKTEHEEAVAIIPNEEASDEKTLVKSASSTVTEGQQDDVFDNAENTDSKLEPARAEEPEEDGIDSEEKTSVLLDACETSNESSEISSPVSELREDESNSTVSSSNPTPYLTDENPSDGTSTYLTPPDELIPETTNQEIGVMSSPESDRDDNRRRYAHPEIARGDIYKVKISHIVSPSSFYCQLSRTETEFCHLMETIQTKYNDDGDEIYDLDSPSVGLPCCAQSPEDGTWYRALVKNIENDDYVTVMLVDLGKRLSIPVERLKTISDVLVTSLPRQAVHCSLVDLEPADAEWSADAVTKMSEVCGEKSLEGEFISRRNKIYNIFLRDPENATSDFINRLLVDLKLATVTGRYSPDSGEGADSTENGEVEQGLKAEESANDEKLSSGSTNIDSHQSELGRRDNTECVEEIIEFLLEQVENEAKDEVEMFDEVPAGHSEQNHVNIDDNTEEGELDRSTNEGNGGLDKELFVDEPSGKICEEERDTCNALQDLMFEKKEAKLLEGEPDEQITEDEELEGSSEENTDVISGEIEDDDVKKSVLSDETLPEGILDQNGDTNVDISSEHLSMKMNDKIGVEEALESVVEMIEEAENSDCIVDCEKPPDDEQASNENLNTATSDISFEELSKVEILSDGNVDDFDVD